MRFANLNLYKIDRSRIDTPQWGALVATVRSIAPDALAVQEVLVDEDQPACDWDTEASTVVQQLAADCGLSATAVRADGSPATVMAHNAHRGWYTAILWNPGSTAPVTGGFRPLGAPDFWHGLTTVQLDIGAAEPLTCVSYHGDPFRGDWRRHEALRLKGLLRTTGGAKPALVLGDFNGQSAAQVPGPDGEMTWYDAELYRSQDHDDLEYQLLPGTIGGQQLVDRRQSEVLLRRGFTVDTAAHLRVGWHPTTGHWRDGDGDPDPWGPRRIDLILATRPVAPALRAYSTHGTADARAASDHLPVSVDLDPAAIGAEV